MTEEKNVPYIVYEGSMARMERMLRRLVIALIITICLLFATNALWLYEWTQYDYESETITLESDRGHANYIGNDGEIYNGTSESETDFQTQEKE